MTRADDSCDATRDVPTPEQRAALRLEVAAVRRSEHRRRFPARLEVRVRTLLGVVTGAVEIAWPPAPSTDAGLVEDLLTGLLERLGLGTPGAGDVTVRLVRPGRPEPHDLDARSAAAVERVLVAAGLRGPGLVVLTRYGWLHPRSGESRSWRRLRVPQAAGA